MCDPREELREIMDQNASPVPALSLDENGRCCGKKPLEYRRPSRRFFCTRCNREFDPVGRQVENWDWKSCDEGMFVMAETSQHAAANDAARRLALPFPFGLNHTTGTEG